MALVIIIIVLIIIMVIIELQVDLQGQPMAGTVEADPVEEAHYRRFKYLHEDDHCDDDNDEGKDDGDDEGGGTMLRRLTIEGSDICMMTMMMDIVMVMMKTMKMVARC